MVILSNSKSRSYLSMLSEEETEMGKVIRVCLLAPATLWFELGSGIRIPPEQAARAPVFRRTSLLLLCKFFCVKFCLEE
jgi:hypothetical protein